MQKLIIIKYVQIHVLIAFIHVENINTLVTLPVKDFVHLYLVINFFYKFEV